MNTVNAFYLLKSRKISWNHLSKELTLPRVTQGPFIAKTFGRQQQVKILNIGTETSPTTIEKYKAQYQNPRRTTKYRTNRMQIRTRQSIISCRDHRRHEFLELLSTRREKHVKNIFDVLSLNVQQRKYQCLEILMF